ncbi:Facilitated trehalose transporter Tret1-like 17 [Homarus americanus]|uniref:Facilitated trehalose transporter Tret1-like 17 n=1 Tax=Homarus americanus TaxID=6706 RepID=A0A8J5J9R4_HOMAM|nr:Facilitated trehalose transporter Tret1-like 17 [Homarus americanus]
MLFIGDIGIHPVPYIVSSEYFPTSIRPQASSVCISAGTVITFATLQLYSPMQATLTQAGLYFFYGAVSFVGVIFSFFAVIETKGKNVG